MTSKLKQYKNYKICLFLFILFLISLTITIIFINSCSDTSILNGAAKNEQKTKVIYFGNREGTINFIQMVSPSCDYKTVLKIGFDLPMDTESAKAGMKLYLMNENEPILQNISLSWKNNSTEADILIAQNYGALQPEKQYWITVDVTVKSYYGNHMENPYECYFTVGQDPSDVFKVVAVSPVQDGTTSVSSCMNNFVSVEFSKPPRPDTVANGFKLLKGSSDISGTVSRMNISEELNYKLELNSGFDASSTYTIIVDKNVLDYKDKPLQYEFTSSFNTCSTDNTSPTVTLITPSNSSSPIILCFSEAMDVNNLINAITVSNSNGITTTINTFDYTTENQYFLGHWDPFRLQPDIYYVMISTAARDVACNQLFPTTFTFSIDHGDIDPPRVSNTNPENGTNNVVLNPIIYINFSEGMKSPDTENATILYQSSNVIETTKTLVGSQLTIIPSSNLTSSTTYNVTISTSAKDTSGNALQPEYTFSFTTGDVIGTGTGIKPTIQISSPVQNYCFNKSTVQLSGFSQGNPPVSYVLVNIDGTITGTASGTNPWSFNSISLSEGSHSAIVTCYDNYGNSSIPASISFKVDSVSPTISITNPIAGSTLGSNFQIEGTSNDLNGINLVKLYFNGTSIIADGTTLWTSTLSSLTTGTYIISASAIDLCGNISVTSINILVDTNIPTATISSPSNGVCLTNSTPLIIGSAYDNGSVSSVQIIIDGISYTATGTNSWNYLSPSLSDGLHSITAIGYDNLGLTSQPDTISITIDTISPTISITNPLNGAVVPKNITVTGNSFDNINIKSIILKIDTFSYPVSGTNNWSFTAPAQIEGIHTIFVEVNDNCNNSNAITISINVDNTSPTVSISPSVNTCSYTGTFSIEGLAGDTYSVASVEIKIDNGLSNTITGTTTWRFITPSLSNGFHSIQAISFDFGNNPSILSSINVYVDTSPTLIQINTPTSNFNACDTVSLSGTYCVSSCKLKTIQYRVDGGVWDNVSYASSGIWSNTSLTLTGSSEHSIQVRIQDNTLESSSAIYNLSTYYLQTFINIISPTNGERIEFPNSINLSGSFSNTDICCTNKTIQFSIDGSTTWTNVSTIGTGYWTHLLNNSYSLDNHSVIVKFSNDCIMTNTSSTVTFNVGLFGLKWITIPGGTFMMGTTSSIDYTNAIRSVPIHTVQITTFDILETEVTVAQYTSFLNSMGASADGTSSTTRWHTEMSNGSVCGISRTGSMGSYTYFINTTSMSSNPVNNITWTNACDFCNWISGTLPSEAQWEYACGGTNHYLWSLSDTFSCSSYCNIVTPCSNSSTCAVKSYSPNTYGLYDMSGNIWEWSYDWFSASGSGGSTGTSSSSNTFYQTCLGLGTVVDPINTYSSMGYRVLHGGSWYNSDLSALRSSYRFMINNSFYSNYTGFRCVRQ